MAKNENNASTVVADQVETESGILTELCGFDTTDPSYDWVSELAGQIENPNYKGGKTETKIGDMTPDEFARAILKTAAANPAQGYSMLTILLEGKAFELRRGSKLESAAIRIRRQLTDAEKRSPDALLTLESLSVIAVPAGSKMAGGKTVPLNCIRVAYKLTAADKERLGLIGPVEHRTPVTGMPPAGK